MHLCVKTLHLFVKSLSATIPQNLSVYDYVTQMKWILICFVTKELTLRQATCNFKFMHQKYDNPDPAVSNVYLSTAHSFQ